MCKTNLVDTTDTNDKGQLWLGVNVCISVLLGLTLALDQSVLGLGVLLGVSGGALDDGTAFQDTGLLGILT